MAAIKYQNISIYDRRGSLEGTKISSFLDTNNIEHNYLGKFTSDTANAQINFLSTHFPGITLPACIYEAVYYENGNLGEKVTYIDGKKDKYQVKYAINGDLQTIKK